MRQEQGSGWGFPRQTRGRLRKWARQRYSAVRRAHRRAKWVARLTRLALAGMLTLAVLVDLVTGWQLRRQLGAIPVLYALLETLQVREIINRQCPTRAQVDHGTIALVLVLNRLMMPLPLYQIADWVAQTVLVHTLKIPASKFNDDRLGRTLDALSPHCEAIWQAVVQRAFEQTEIDLSLIFYDLTAFVVHGAYRDSQCVDFGFAHNTPKNKRKFKAGLNVTADGNLPVDYSLCSGRTADMATVEENMDRLRSLLQRQGWPVEEVLVVGDRANLSDELVFAFQDRGLHYLAGLRTLKKTHKSLLVAVPEERFYAHPLTQESGPKGYWGLPCQVPFEHEGRRLQHRGLVVISGPMRTALRRTRAAQLKTLRQELKAVQEQIGQPYCRTVKSIQRRANAKLDKSPVGKLMRAKAYQNEHGQVCLRWWVDSYQLWQVMQRDGRYLLVTNDWALSPQQIFARYHQKDGVEKCFCISKRDLKVSPIYLHKDDRIAAMLLINMLALLAYNLLERQAHQHGLMLTTRRIIAILQSLDVVETICWDGSRLFRLTPIDQEQIMLLHILAEVIHELRLPHWSHSMLPPQDRLAFALPPPPSQLISV